MTTVVYAENSAAMTKGTAVKVLAFGDSLTAGYRLPPAEAYPAQLEKLAKDQGFAMSITNGGVSGDTSGQGLRRLDWNLKAASYDWVLLCLGANDGLRQLPVAQMKSNLDAIIEQLKKKNIKILLIGMRLPLNFSAAYRGDFESVYAALAKKHSLPLVPFALDGVALQSQLTLDDQIHPNKDGQRRVAENVWKVFRAQLASGKK